MSTEKLNWRSLLMGLLMGSAALVATGFVSIELGLIDATTLDVTTGPVVAYLVIIVLAMACVGGSLLGYELSRRRARGMSWSVLAIATAVAAFFFAPESPNIEVAHSNPDPRVDVYLPLLNSAKTQLTSGDAEAAIVDLMYAAELASTSREGSVEFCLFGESAGIFADQFLATGHPQQAVVAYAIAGRFAQDCPHLDARELRLRQENAQAATLIVGDKAEPAF